MEILQRDDLLLINEMTIERHGGKYTPPENLKNPEAFEYLVSTINEMVFGQEMYPGLEGKAAFYLYKINANHIFGDGNKRTGLEAALLFLKLNGFRLKDKLVAIQKTNQVFMPKNKDVNSLELLFNLVMEIADSQHSMEDCTDWFKANTTKKTLKSS